MKTEVGMPTEKRGISRVKECFCIAQKGSMRNCLSYDDQAFREASRDESNVTWSNLNSCTSLNLNSAMGFYFMRIDEDEGDRVLELHCR